jgi:hypothetical protein
MATKLVQLGATVSKTKIAYAGLKCNDIRVIWRWFAVGCNRMKSIKNWYLTSRSEYEAAGAGIGASWRETLGRNFPPSTLLYIAGLVDERAKVEIEVTAFVPGA